MSNAIRLGALVNNILTDIVSLRCDALSVNNYSTGEEAETAYSVPGATTLFVTEIYFSVSVAAGSVRLLYGDTAVSNSASAPDVPVLMSPRYESINARELVRIPCFFAIPTGKFPALQCQVGAAQAGFSGVEV